jgi:hypothetical protein
VENELHGEEVGEGSEGVGEEGAPEAGERGMQLEMGRGEGRH